MSHVPRLIKFLLDMYFNLIFGLLGLLFTTVFLQHRWFIYVVGLLHFHSTVLCVTFGLNVRLDLSGEAATKSLCMLGAELMFKVLGEGAWAMAVWMIRDDEGAGAFPGVLGGSGESSGVLRKVARLSQELRLKV